MFPEVSVDLVVSSGGVEFRFPGQVSMFMLAVQRENEVIWELLANEGKETLGSVISIKPIEEATHEELELLRDAEERFAALVREAPPLTTPISSIRYGQVPEGYREKAAAPHLIPGRYHFTVFFAQGQASGEFEVPAA